MKQSQQENVILIPNYQTQMNLLQMIRISIFILCFALLVSADIKEETNAALTKLYNERFLRGISVQITKKDFIVYNFNIGLKNQRNQSIDNNTVVKIASLSKSFASVALMQLVQKKLVSLTTTLTSIFGFQVKNPKFPDVPITLQQVMSHTSSIVDCDPNYLNFLSLTGSAKTGLEVPLLKDLLMKGGKYYGDCLYSSKKPGSYFQYANLNYGIIGTVIQKLSGSRFDLYARSFLQRLTTNQTQIPTFAAWMLKDSNNLATLYRGQNDIWVPQTDYYPNGVIPVRNVTDYVIGSNGVLFSPQAGLRASVTHLCNYMYMLANKGVTKENFMILSEQSVKQILKPRYQYHGLIGGAKIQYQNYGFGIYKTSMLPVDRIINHEEVYGHIGESYGLLSGYYFWKDYTFSFYFTGNLRGYINNTGTMYEQQRMTVHSIVDNFVAKFVMKEFTKDLLQK